MSSSSLSSQEVQASFTGLTPPAQSIESDVGGPASTPHLPASASPSRQPLSGSTGENVAPINPPSNAIGDPSPVFSLPTTAAGPPTPRAPSNPGNDALQDPSRQSVLSSPGYIASPSFSYNMFPRAGGPQQSTSPVIRLTAPMSPAALQPPVPGQPSVTRPFFSYNVVPRANLSPSPGQQFQPTTATNQPGPQREMLHPSMYSSQASASTQCLGINSNTTGTHSLPAPSQNTVDTETDRASVSSASFSSQSTLSSTTIYSTSGTPHMNPATVPRPVGPNFHTPPGMPGMSGPPGSLSAAPPSSNVTVRPMVPDSSHGSQKPVVHFSSSTAPNPVSFPSQQQMYQPYPSLHAVAPSSQAPWLNPSQSGAMQRSPFVPYPGAVPAPSLLPLRTEPPPVILPNMKPPAIFNMPNSVEKPPPLMGIYQPTGNLTMQLPPPGVDHDKQTNSLHGIGEGIPKKEAADVWTIHKTETGVIYYYNSLTRESTYEKPAGLKVEDKNVTRPTPVSWEKLPGTDWALVTTNDGKNYYYDTKNKVSSWQLPPEVAELTNHQDNDAIKAAVDPISNSSAEVDKAPLVATLNPPALQTGGRDATSLRTSAAGVSSSALDLVKKKLQDTSGPTTSSPAPASSVALVSNSDSPKLTEASTKGQDVENNKQKVKDANGDGSLSDSSSDSEDTDTGPSKEECAIQFKEMLKERGIAPFSKWDKELPKIVFDPRFKAVPSHATRRTLFEHYVRTRAEEERKEKRAAQKAAIEGFKKLLEEASEDINKRTDYQSFKKKWGNDQRFEALDRKERELLLNERVLSLKKAAAEKIEATRAIVVSDFKSMLKERGDITLTSRWSRVKDSFRSDPRYRSIKHQDREALFNVFLSELKAVEDESERTAKAKKEELEKLKRREQETRKRKQREEQEMESLRLKVRRKEAEASYQALLVETIKDPKASWTESKPKLEKDPQGRFTNTSLDLNDMEKLFREHVKNLYERCVQDFCALLAEFITAEAGTKVSDQGKTVLTSWSEAKHLIKHDARYSKLSSKDREKLWLRHAEDVSGRRKSVSKDGMNVDRKSKTTSDHAKRSPRTRSRR